MKTLTGHDFDAHWDALAERILRLRQLDLSDPCNLSVAIEESQRLLGAVEYGRHLLEQMEPCTEPLQRRAA